MMFDSGANVDNKAELRLFDFKFTILNHRKSSGVFVREIAENLNGLMKILFQSIFVQSFKNQLQNSDYPETLRDQLAHYFVFHFTVYSAFF
jgi:hypothetical protein